MSQNTLLRATVRIHAYGRPVDFAKPFLVSDRLKGVGTGAFVRAPHDDVSHLYILTCSHCVDMADTVKVMLPFLGMTEHPATVVSILPRLDLAVLSLSTPCPCCDNDLHGKIKILPLGSSEVLQLGEKLTAVGYPLGGTALKASDGVYAGFQERLQHTVSISPGNSGGPLMNARGEIIGINNSGIVSVDASNVGFAVPIESFKSMKTAMFRAAPSGEPSPERVVHLPVYGFEFAPITRAHAKAIGATSCLNGVDGGVQILTVLPHSAMHVANVRADDILLEFDGHALDTVGETVVSWNYQKVRLQDVLARAIDDRDYDARIWRASTQTCETVRVRPKVYLPGALKALYPPFDPVPYIVVVGVVIMPLVANHATCPATINTYMCKKTAELAEPCVVITHVFNGTFAQIEGPLYAGDELSHVNGHAVKTLDDVENAIGELTDMGSRHRVFTLRTTTGKLLVVSAPEALASERQAASQNLYNPNAQFVRSLESCSSAD